MVYLCTQIFVSSSFICFYSREERRIGHSALRTCVWSRHIESAAKCRASLTCWAKLSPPRLQSMLRPVPPSSSNLCLRTLSAFRRRSPLSVKTLSWGGTFYIHLYTLFCMVKPPIYSQCVYFTVYTVQFQGFRTNLDLFFFFSPVVLIAVSS